MLGGRKTLQQCTISRCSFCIRSNLEALYVMNGAFLTCIFQKREKKYQEKQAVFLVAFVLRILEESSFISFSENSAFVAKKFTSENLLVIFFLLNFHASDKEGALDTSLLHFQLPSILYPLIFSEHNC